MRKNTLKKTMVMMLAAIMVTVFMPQMSGTDAYAATTGSVNLAAPTITEFDLPDYLSLNIYKVKWTKVKGAYGYQVYRTVKSKNKWKKVATVLYKTSYTETARSMNCDKRYQYKVRAFKYSKGTYTYGKFSKRAEYKPDWDINEVVKELNVYGQSFELPLYEDKGDYIAEKSDGSKYHMMAIYGLQNVIGSTEHARYVYMFPETEDEAVKTALAESEQYPFDPNDTLGEITPATGNWNPPEYISYYTSKKLLMKELKNYVRVEVKDIANGDPLYYDKTYESWKGSITFRVYAEKRPGKYDSIYKLYFLS